MVSTDLTVKSKALFPALVGGNYQCKRHIEVLFLPNTGALFVEQSVSFVLDSPFPPLDFFILEELSCVMKYN